MNNKKNEQINQECSTLLDVANDNLVWHTASVSRVEKEKVAGQRGQLLWFTGLSGAGKSTLANAMDDYFRSKGKISVVLDGDNIRHGLCSDLGFSDADRGENIRRVGEVSKLFVEAGVIVLAAFISPFLSDRKKVRSLLTEGDFVEIYCDSTIDICEKRDVKGLYQKARLNMLKNFTGLSSSYEAPEAPEIHLDTTSKSVLQCMEEIISYMQPFRTIGNFPDVQSTPVEGFT
ncbi:adenylyl-sulfate kinase [uncultured Herbaspirillum sp.]|uniref:adenylyl-sulfate kinase n=1 Tax=uncultured Herbaspirillum sp. TaxID=160236 RepID=UPI002587A0B3|nr:adenylyl-sulfate kinase [uncultured Herbaspirillum sp.]